jgi:holo-[acyl-carrier protein] synthase
MAPVAGLGVDLVRIERFRRLLDEHKETVIQRLFTVAEQAYAVRKVDPAPFLAARFAAKEAFLKALSLGLRQGLSWREIEVVKDGAGKPLLELQGRTAEVFAERGGGTLHLSLSHDGDYAVASVVLEREK